MTMNDDFLDAALKRQTQAPATDEAAVARVLARLAGPLPRQKRPFWRLPTAPTPRFRNSRGSAGT